jgi:hypothetical protein
MISATNDDHGRGAASRVSALTVSAALIVAVAACGGTLAACSGNPAHPAASGTHSPGRPAAVADATPAGRLTGLPGGHTVAWQQPVSGVVTGLSAGDQAWIVIDPSLAPAYWPQQGPLQLSPAGGFRVTAYFGASAKKDSGERFTLRLVLAPPAAGAEIRAFQIQPAHQQGMLKLPAGVRTLAQVTVIRR